MKEPESIQSEGESQKEGSSKDGILGFIGRPFDWLKMLSDELHWSFVSAVVIVYGINQGLSMGLSKISTQYYMKDDQKLQPSEAQVYFGILQLPWVVKPLWGLLTDTLPIFGYRRRPYFIIAGFLGIISMVILSLKQDLHLAFALLCLITSSAGMAVADSTIDACVTENSISHPYLASDMQSLCGVSSSIGQLIGYTGVFGVLSMPAALVSEKLRDAGKAMWIALKCKNVWRPCLYMYVSLALSLQIHEGMFYWYTEAKNGPFFSKEAVGAISSIGAVGSLLGILLYQNAFKHYPFHLVLFWAQLLYGASGLLDLILVSRANLRIGIPDYFVAVSDAAISHMITRLKWMPLLVLSTKLCPSGIEGTFFALLMSIDHIGSLTAAWAGGLCLHVLHVTRTQFGNLWVAIVVRSFLRVVPVGLLFLVPRSDDPNASILPDELLNTRKGEESEDMEMVSLVNNRDDPNSVEE
nr:probable folate-biopterin transporter 3 [Ipomoea batatas]